MFTLKSEVGFDTAHFLEGYEGHCKNIHGHRYRLVVKVSAEELQETGPLRGMVDDFGNLKKMLREIHDEFDHKLLIEDTEKGRKLAKVFEDNDFDFDIKLVPYRTTVEEMSRAIFRMIRAKGINVTEVELFESPTNSCTYTEGA